MSILVGVQLSTNDVSAQRVCHDKPVATILVLELPR